MLYPDTPFGFCDGEEVLVICFIKGQSNWLIGHLRNVLTWEITPHCKTVHDRTNLQVSLVRMHTGFSWYRGNKAPSSLRHPSNHTRKHGQKSEGCGTIKVSLAHLRIRRNHCQHCLISLPPPGSQPYVIYLSCAPLIRQLQGRISPALQQLSD